MAREMTPQERAAVYKYHRVFDGYNFLSGPKGMEEIVGHDMELVSLEDHEAALQETRRAALLEAAQQVCMHCGKRAIGLQVGVNGPNAAGNYVHNPPEDSRVKESALCSATSIWSLIRYEDRLAQEG